MVMQGIQDDKEFPVINPIGNMNVYEQLSQRVDELQEAMKQMLLVQIKQSDEIVKLQQGLREKADADMFERY